MSKIYKNPSQLRLEATSLHLLSQFIGDVARIGTCNKDFLVIAFGLGSWVVCWWGRGSLTIRAQHQSPKVASLLGSVALRRRTTSEGGRDILTKEKDPDSKKWLLKAPPPSH